MKKAVHDAITGAVSVVDASAEEAQRREREIAEAPAPVDQSDIDQLQKQMKAVLLCVAQVGGLTVPQIRAMFKNKFDQLP